MKMNSIKFYYMLRSVNQSLLLGWELVKKGRVSWEWSILYDCYMVIALS